MNEIDIQLEQARQELAQLRAHGALENQRQMLENHQYYQVIKEGEKRLKEILEEELNTKGPLQMYTKSIKIARNSDVAPSYAMTLEAQVCRSVHHLVVLKKQLALVKTACDSYVDLMQGAILNITEEKSLIEMHGMNSIFALDSAKSSMKDRYAIELQEQKDALHTLENKDCENPALTETPSIPKGPLVKLPDMIAKGHGDASLVNVSNNVFAVVENDKIVSYVVRQQNNKNGWLPLSKASRTSSVHRLTQLNRTRSSIMA